MTDRAPVVPLRRPALALVDPATLAALPEQIAAMERAGILVKPIDYGRLMNYADELRQIIRERGIDFVLFSRNDQVHERVAIGPLIRSLRVGYSSFSAIDSAHAREQARVCLDDLLNGPCELTLPDLVPSAGVTRGDAGTFSLIFDVEQLGGARFGLPRVLALLDEYGARATFFVTGFIHDVYPNALASLTRRGHEIGWHGAYHEYLSGRPPDEQIHMLRTLRRDFRNAEPVSGANFIGRMDANTVRAMVAVDLEYFVELQEHRYRPFAYAGMSPGARLLWTPQGTIWSVPINVETNNRPWPIVQGMIDAAIRAGQNEGWHHLNVLLHPFRDGSLRHIGALRKMLEYLQRVHRYRPAPVAEIIRPLPRHEPSRLIYYGLQGASPPLAPRGCWRRWWLDASRYQQRVGRLYRRIERDGQRPGLCIDVSAERITYAVYPHVPPGACPVTAITDDPLLPAGVGIAAAPGLPGGHDSGVNAFLPRTRASDVATALRTSMPRSLHDVTAFIPEATLRLAYHLTPGRHVF